MVGVESGDLKRSPSCERKYLSISERSNSAGNLKVGEIESSLCCGEGQLESLRTAAAEGWLTTMGLVVPPFRSQYIPFLLAFFQTIVSAHHTCNPPHALSADRSIE